MKLLLDTHIWLWSLLEPERLSTDVHRALVSGDNELWLSPISVWEALMLVERGRLKIDTEPQAWVEKMSRALPGQEAPVTHQVALWSRRLDLPHQDPADRFLAATAVVFELTFVTADSRMAVSRDYSVLVNG